jgi:hypothetical protein
MAEQDTRDIDQTMAMLGALVGGDARTGAAGDKPANRYDGEEPTKSIWVVVNPRGRLISVDISRTWRKRLPPERFAGALFDAYQAGVFTAFATELAAGRIQPAERPVREPLVGGYADLRDEEWLAVTRARLRGIDKRLRALSTGPVALPEREIRSANGYLTLRLRGGGLLGITGNAHALELSHADRLRQEVLDVFRVAGLTAES